VFRKRTSFAPREIPFHAIDLSLRLADQGAGHHAVDMRPEDDSSKVSRPAETRRFWFTVSMAALVLFGAITIFLLLSVVPKFEQIFADALPGKPLPDVTEFIITDRIGLALVSLISPVFWIFLQRWQNSNGVLWINIGIVLFILGIAITVFALFMPMIGTTVGMYDAGSH
jgi:hypothetical protein